MLSYRDHLARIGVGPGEAVSYLGFASRPKSLRAAMRSMHAPHASDFSQVSDIFEDEFWTDEVQGVAWNGSHWIFVANARQAKPDSEDKALYVFEGGQPLRDDRWARRLKFKDVPHPIDDTTESDCHWGQISYHDGRVFVSHFWEHGPKKDLVSAVVFESQGGHLAFDRWIELDFTGASGLGDGRKPEFQGVNPWDGLLYSYQNGVFFMHDPATGVFTGRTLVIEKVIQGIQGVCFSPNGHLYVASTTLHPDDARYQTIWYFSALNGHYFGVIPVLAEEGLPDQELEGVCYADVTLPNGRAGQIHVVLLENPDVALDNIFFKSFAASRPDLV